MARKIIKINVTKTRVSTNVTTFKYPKDFDGKKIIKGIFIDESSDPRNVNDFWVEEGIAVIDEKDLEALTKSSDIVGLTQEDAELFLQRPYFANKAAREFISDEQKVIDICKKIVSAEALTQADKDAIDSSKVDAGIVKSKPISITALLEE